MLRNSLLLLDIFLVSDRVSGIAEISGDMPHDIHDYLLYRGVFKSDLRRKADE